MLRLILVVATLCVSLGGAQGQTLVDPYTTTSPAVTEPAQPMKRGSVLGRTGEVARSIWSTLPVRWNFISSFLLRGATSVVEAYLPVRITQLSDNPATAIGWVLGLYGAATTAATWSPRSPSPRRPTA